MNKIDSRALFADLRASLRLPVVAAPMFLVTGPDLVIASCRAGVAGSFPSTNARTIDDFEAWLERITDELRLMRWPGSGPFASRWLYCSARRIMST